MVAHLTTGVSIDGAGWEFGFRFGGVAGGMGSGVQRGQRLQHAQQAVGGGQLQVFLRDVAHLSAAVSGLETQKMHTDGDDSQKCFNRKTHNEKK